MRSLLFVFQPTGIIHIKAKYDVGNYYCYCLLKR